MSGRVCVVARVRELLIKDPLPPGIVKTPFALATRAAPRPAPARRLDSSRRSVNVDIGSIHQFTDGLLTRQFHGCLQGIKASHCCGWHRIATLKLLIGWIGRYFQ